MVHRWGAPGPMMCGPKSLIPQTGYWDFNYACDNPWATPPESCDAYEGQKGGKAINDVAYPNGGEWQKLFVAAHHMMLPLTDAISKLQIANSRTNRRGGMLLVGSWSHSNFWSMVSCLYHDLNCCCTYTPNRSFDVLA